MYVVILVPNKRHKRWKFWRTKKSTEYRDLTLIYWKSNWGVEYYSRSDVSCGVQGGTSCVRRSMEKRTPVGCSTVFNVMMVSEEKVLKLETLIRWKPQIRPSWKSSENPWGVLFRRDPFRPGPANSSFLAYRYSAGSVSFMGDLSSETKSISTPWMTTVFGTGFRVFIIFLTICSRFRNGRNTNLIKLFIFFTRESGSEFQPIGARRGSSGWRIS